MPPSRRRPPKPWMHRSRPAKHCHVPTDLSSACPSQRPPPRRSSCRSSSAHDSALHVAARCVRPSPWMHRPRPAKRCPVPTRLPSACLSQRPNAAPTEGARRSNPSAAPSQSATRARPTRRPMSQPAASAQAMDALSKTRQTLPRLNRSACTSQCLSAAPFQSAYLERA
jgi:hypothetical protein